jgi:hypothetical protein
VVKYKGQRIEFHLRWLVDRDGRVKKSASMHACSKTLETLEGERER